METPDAVSENTAAFIYPIGKVLQLNASPNNTANKLQTSLQVKVKQRKQPWTLSCGMVVEIEENSDGSEPIEGLRKSDEAFLKIFDRRFAEQHRQDNGVDTWSEDVENEFLASLRSGKTESFLDKLHTVPRFQRDTEDDWDTAENEAYLADELRKCFNSEIAIYSCLQQHQGKIIPRFLAGITLGVPPPDAALTTQQQELYQLKGILLQYLSGFSLSSMVQNAPRSSWQDIVDQAIRIVHVLGDNNILNADVRPDNFVVVPKDQAYRVFMIDFGQCRLRRKDESDAEWGRAKWTQDEEGAVGAVMRSRMRKVGFELQFEPSWRYLAWAPGEDD
ncbi:hypothetical protein B0T10DRAFT_502161 [Thelonectria olida]|uniref:Protein kinase domain-containing protein n=1 Tax=Thelonectria olida TaxID=1576542 RepID=A0A9P8VPN7_9HYPO|nr:hypothetical protein B0T10DRAFT_502161 [Thelonectria olida]